MAAQVIPGVLWQKIMQGADKGLETLLNLLGYESDRGLMTAYQFRNAPNHRHALLQAGDRMSVKFSFGLWSSAAGVQAPLLSKERFTPLVYLASVADEAQAKDVHKLVWNQGLVPYLICASDQCFWICQGFAFSGSFADVASRFSWGELDAAAASGGLLEQLKAKKLRGALHWADVKKVYDETVDRRLLNSLAYLSLQLGEDADGRAAIVPKVTNAVIGRFLYLYFLVDRGFITQEMVSRWGFGTIDLTSDKGRWSVNEFWQLLKVLNSIFNGSIFPISDADRLQVTDAHLHEIRRVIRHGDTVGPRSYQYSFMDYDFSVIRTESLSAIYEMFLHVEDHAGATDSGAHYTPPFLADYCIDRVEDIQPLSRAVKVLDPAAGSGVFLVGALRRMIEATLGTNETTLPLETLHEIMTNSIYGVELNARACHVAAFSLYLTMLDYVSDSDISKFIEANEDVQPKLFPALLGQNLLEGDFFDVAAAAIPRCEVVIGNPPWKAVDDLPSQSGIRFANDTRANYPIGDRQAAELFCWKVVDRHLADGGVCSLLIPAKSLLNGKSASFVDGITKKHSLVGVVDFSHLRYSLFTRGRKPIALEAEGKEARPPRHVAALLMLKKVPPTSEAWSWVYKPMMPSQPAFRGRDLWTITHDWTKVEWLSAEEVGAEKLFRGLASSRLDDLICSQIYNGVAKKRFLSLGDLSRVGIEFWRGDTKVCPRSYALGTGGRTGKFAEYALINHLSYDEDAREWRANRNSDIVPLSADIRAALPDSLRMFFSGNVALMRRDVSDAHFVIPPVGFTDSFIAAASAQEGSSQILRALCRYFTSRFFQYIAHLSGRSMMSDRRRLEVETLKRMPWPFKLDEDLSCFLSASENEVDEIIFDSLKIKGTFRRAIDEFVDLRMRLRDGQSPLELLAPVLETGAEGALSEYSIALSTRLDPKGGFEVEPFLIEEGVVCIGVRFIRGAPLTHGSMMDAFANYEKAGASSVTHSRFMHYDRNQMHTYLFKPNRKMFFTLDRAFEDAEAILASTLYAS